MAAQMGGKPVYILSEGARRIRGRDARRMNIMVARVIAEAVRSTLGPKGMDKMLVDTTGDIVITNDGAAVLKSVDVKHPAAKMMVEVAKSQENAVGDGTTTAVVLAGELLKKAEDLLDKGIHATIITRGYRMAEEETLAILKKLGKKVREGDKELLTRVALTALSAKMPGVSAKEHIASMAVEAVMAVAQKVNGEVRIDKDDIKIQKHMGEGVGDSFMVKGIVLDKEKLHPRMPDRVSRARLALVKSELKVKKTETDAKFNITSPEAMQSFMEEERQSLKKMAEDVAAAGANVLMCQKDIDDLVGYYLAKEGVLAVKNVSEGDMKLIAKATGGSVVSAAKDITAESLGTASEVSEKKIAGKTFVFIEGCRNPRAVTLFVRGGTEHITDEVERSLDDALSVVKDVLELTYVLPGGGACEVEVAHRLRDYAEKISGREQLAILEFANAIETIPRIIAENTGLDPIDVLIELRATHERGRKAAGVDIASGKAVDMYRRGIVEPLKVKTQVVKTATETANMILRIDDVIAAKGALGEKEEEASSGSGAPCGPSCGPGGMPM
jgi:thermosome